MHVMALLFERLDVSVSDWGGILNGFQDRTVFQSPAWLAFVVKTQRAEPVFAALKDGSTTLGYFCGLIVKRFGLRILGSPLPGWTTSYMGLNLLNGTPRTAALGALLQFAFDDMRCVHVEFMDRNLSLDNVKDLGWEQRRFAGFEIDLTKTEDELLKAMTSACRRCIRRASDLGIVIEEAHDLAFADEYHAQLVEVFRKHSLPPPYRVNRVRELIDRLLDTGQLLLLRARDPNGRCIATGIFPASNDTMFFWGGASWKDSLSYRPNEPIQWYAMRYWRARGIQRYDMGGGGEYKRKFGGYEIAVPWLRKSKYPVISTLRAILKQALTLRRRWVGRAAALARPAPGEPAEAVIRQVSKGQTR